MAAATPVIDFRIKANRQAGRGVCSALKREGARRSEGGELGPSAAGGAVALARERGRGPGRAALHLLLLMSGTRCCAHFSRKINWQTGQESGMRVLSTAVFQLPLVKRKLRCVRTG